MSADNNIKKPSLQKIEEVTEVLNTLLENSSFLSEVPDEKRIALIKAAGKLSRPDINDDRKRKKEAKINALRRQAIGSAKRAEKIRTYNFPQNRVTDHRRGKSWKVLDEVIDGNLEKII